MGAKIECFLLDRTDLFREYMRRFRFGAAGDPPCPKNFIHDATVNITDRLFDASRDDISGMARDECEGTSLPIDLSDARWPVACACGYTFLPENQWQHGAYRLYRDTRNGELLTPREAPIGAVYRARWYEGSDDHVGDDKQSWVIVTPGGAWACDGPSSDGRRWTRMGTAPKFTVRASILQQKRSPPWRDYHGFMSDGILEEC